jgi:hypothetical protein
LRSPLSHSRHVRICSGSGGSTMKANKSFKL